jgi:hypothetical protein
MLEQIRMACITQRLYSKRVDDVIAETKRQLEGIGLGRKLKGKRIAITAGQSRHCSHQRNHQRRC